MTSPQPWPLLGLRLKTEHLELHVTTDADLHQLAQVAREGIHDPSEQPFSDAWTDKPPEELARSILQWEWGRRAAWKPENWTCAFAVILDGNAVGVQAVSGKDFRLLREVSTGSWLGLPFQRRGYGTEMRAMALRFAFDYLKATHARTTAMVGNKGSLGVTRKFGYVRDGGSRIVVRGKPTAQVHYTLTLGGWLRYGGREECPTEVCGFDDCREWFGLE